MAAMRAVDNIDELGRLLDNRVAVRWAELDAPTAIRIGTTVPLAEIEPTMAAPQAWEHAGVQSTLDLEDSPLAGPAPAEKKEG